MIRCRLCKGLVGITTCPYCYGTGTEAKEEACAGVASLSSVLADPVQQPAHVAVEYQATKLC